MKFRAAIAVFVLLGGALAARTAVAESPAAPKDDPNRVTCEVVRPVGSRLGGVRTCRTQAEWAQYRAEMRDVTQRVQNEGATRCVPTAARPNIC